MIFLWLMQYLMVILILKNFTKKMNNFKFEDLIFRRVNKKIFPAIKLKYKINEYPSAPIIINAANEILVDQFLKKKIPF